MLVSKKTIPPKEIVLCFNDLPNMLCEKKLINCLHFTTLIEAGIKLNKPAGIAVSVTQRHCVFKHVIC